MLEPNIGCHNLVLLVLKTTIKMIGIVLSFSFIIVQWSVVLYIKKICLLALFIYVSLLKYTV
jgi:hypothetical protein